MRRWVPLCLGVLLAGCAVPADQGPDDATGALLCVEPCRVGIHAGALWEPHVAVNPLDSLHVVASSHELVRDTGAGSYWHWALAHASFDGGRTWSTARLPGGPDADPDHPLHRYNDLEDSVVAFLPDGTLAWSALALHVVAQPGVAGYVSSGALVVFRSLDGGLTFPEVSVVASASGGTVVTGGPLPLEGRALRDDQDKNWHAVSPDGTVLLAWTRNEERSPRCLELDECSTVLVSRSTDGARSWSEPSVVYREVASGAQPLVRADGGWVVALRDTETSQAVVAVSTDEGATWVTSSLGLTRKFPALAASPHEGGERLFLVYPAGEGDDREGGQAVVLRWSDDGGATWTEPLPVHAPDRDGFTMPAVAPAPGGGVYLTHWHPRAHDSELRVVLFVNGTLHDPVPLARTEGPVSPLGDYMGLATDHQGGAFAVWTTRADGTVALQGARLGVG